LISFNPVDAFIKTLTFSNRIPCFDESFKDYLTI